MRVQILRPGSEPTALTPMAFRPGPLPAPPTYGAWRPRAVIGATSSGGLLLPDADATAGQAYAPRGVHLDAERVVVCDTGNHRVLVFDGLPDSDGAEATAVLGQPNATTEGPQAGGRGPERGLNLPTGVLVDDGRLVVADAWNHRILVWDDVPTATDVAPDLVLGQPDAVGVTANAGREPDLTTFYWPFGIAVIEGRFVVCDTGNRRVLVWADGIPEGPDVPADVLLGQPGPSDREENRGGAVGADSFRWPHAAVGDGRGGLLVADAGNHRVLGWHRSPDADGPADYVLGQPDLTTAVEFPYRPQTGTSFRFPYGLATFGNATGPGLAVGDTANNRVLLWDEIPHDPTTEPDRVLAQPSFAANGENRWQFVDRDTLCWPYGLGSVRLVDRDLIAVADSGNNRVVLWEAPR